MPLVHGQQPTWVLQSKMVVHGSTKTEGYKARGVGEGKMVAASRDPADAGTRRIHRAGCASEAWTRENPKPKTRSVSWNSVKLSCSLKPSYEGIFIVDPLASLSRT